MCVNLYKQFFPCFILFLKSTHERRIRKGIFLSKLLEILSKARAINAVLLRNFWIHQKIIYAYFCFLLKMGQALSCASCKFRSTKIAPLGTLPSAMKRSNPSIVGQKTSSFHRPSHSSPEWLSMELSNFSSLATISLGSVKTLSSELKGEITNNEITPEENKESSPSSKKHPGRF